MKINWSKWAYIGLWLLVIVLLTGTTAQAQPLRLPHVDFDCDGEITVNDPLLVVTQYGATDAPTLWAYDLDHDGAIDERDVRIAIVEIGRTDLPTPPWCLLVEVQSAAD